jgi:Leucine-rich repeat (LRR) protein
MNMQFLSKLLELHSLKLLCFDIPNIFKNQALSKLINLDLYRCNVDDTVVTGILMNCPHLKSLVLEGDSITDDSFQHIGNCKNLEHLKIPFCSSLTDKSMEYVGAGCPRLKHLDIGHCIGLTNKSTEYVCKGCQKLKYLAIESCPEMTDAVLDNILKCRELEVLILSWNSQLLGTSFLLIPSNLIYLTELDVYGCDALDEKCVHELQALMPNLKITRGDTVIEEPDINLGDAAIFISESM